MPVNQHHIQLLRQKISREENQYNSLTLSFPRNTTQIWDQYGAKTAQAARSFLYADPEEQTYSQQQFYQTTTEFLQYLLRTAGYLTPDQLRFLSSYYSTHEIDLFELMAELTEQTCSARQARQEQEEAERQAALAALESEDDSEEDEEESDLDDLDSQAVENLFDVEDDIF